MRRAGWRENRIYDSRLRQTNDERQGRVARTYENLVRAEVWNADRCMKRKLDERTAFAFSGARTFPPMANRTS
jgi:hypothetical protein